ncbi:MAG TPA: hypothetical protein VLW85_10415 [Myxococcales bacterium]|nr:hypothetical protein [Myxococcales bacterium]
MAPKMKIGWASRLVQSALKRRRSRQAASQAGVEAVAASQAGPVLLRDAQDGDFAAVTALQARNGLVPDTAAGWQRLWRDNPALGDGPPLSRGWVLETPAGIVGYAGNIPLRGFFRGSALRLAAGHSLTVDPGYRLHARRLVSAFLRQPGADVCFSDSANAPNGKMLELQKARPMPQPDYDVVLFWIFNRGAFLRSIARRLGMEGPLASAGSVLGGRVMDIEAALRGRGPGTIDGGSGVDVVAPSAIDGDFEALWRRKLAATRLMIMDRSAVALRWHFDVPGNPGKTAVLRCHREGRLAGYLVLMSTVDQAGLRKMMVADMLVEGDDSGVARELLAAAFRHAREGGHDVLELLGFPDAIRGICRSWKPYARRLSTPPYLFKVHDAALRDALADGSAWYATPYDGDWTLIP